jgi:hypothetical protein
MKALIGLVLIVLLAALVLQVVVMGGATSLHQRGQLGQEIDWLERWQPVMVWEKGLDAEIDKLYRERIKRELLSGQLERALLAFRHARAHAKARGVKPDRELTALGIETLTRVADRVQASGRLGSAADWDDSLFVFAIRAQEPSHRYAGLAAFMEGLDLRVRDGKPCEALARVTWAKRGLGGEVPGLQSSVEEDLRNQCDQALRHGRGR